LVIRPILTAALTLISRGAGAQDRVAAVADPEPHIETVGMGERRIPPDRASVHLLVENKAPEAAVAAAANARAVQAVRDTLRRFGVDSAVTTASYSVGPNYEPPRPTDREPRQAGYVARTLLRVQLGRIDLVGRTIDAGLAGGATGVQGVFFEASTTSAARRDALALAAAEARLDAERLARALGGTLGPLLSTSTSSAGMDGRRIVQTRMDVAAGMSYPTQIAPNEIVVAAVVTTRWRFVPNR
jgi:uncharacterized protein YggE